MTEMMGCREEIEKLSFEVEGIPGGELKISEFHCFVYVFLFPGGKRGGMKMIE